MSHEDAPYGVEAAKRTVTVATAELLAPVEWREDKQLTLGTGAINRWRMNFYPGDLQVSERIVQRYVLFRLKDTTHSYAVIHNALPDAEYTPGMVTGFSWSDANDTLHVWQQFGHRISDAIAMERSPEAQRHPLYRIDAANPQAQWAELVQLVGAGQS